MARAVLGALALAAIGALGVPPAAADPAAKARCDVPPALSNLAIALPRVGEKLAMGEEVRIVTLGSSSTAGAGASAPERAYPARLTSYLRHDVPGGRMVVLNRGVNGETDADMLRRLQRDVLDERPDLVIWQTGANTVLRDGDAEADARDVGEGLARMAEAGVEVVLMDLQFAPGVMAKAGADAMIARTAEIAAQRHVGLFRRFALMRHLLETEQARLDDLIAPDRTHQADFGYDCVARALAAGIEAAAGVAAGGPLLAHHATLSPSTTR